MHEPDIDDRTAHPAGRWAAKRAARAGVAGAAGVAGLEPCRNANMQTCRGSASWIGGTRSGAMWIGWRPAQAQLALYLTFCTPADYYSTLYSRCNAMVRKVFKLVQIRGATEGFGGG